MLLMEQRENEAEASNLSRLQSFVGAAMRRSAGLSPERARRLLQTHAEVIRRHLQALSGWASSPAAGPCPSYLIGLSAFDLADAAEALEAEAARRCA